MAECSTEDDNASDRCIQEIVYTPDFDQIFSDKNISAPVANCNTVTGGKSGYTIRSLSSTAELITPGPPNHLNPRASPTMRSAPCSYSATLTPNIGSLQNLAQTLPTPQSSPQTCNQQPPPSQQQQQPQPQPQQTLARPRMYLLQRQPPYTQQQPPPPPPQQCRQQQPYAAPQVLLASHSPQTSQPLPPNSNANRYDSNNISNLNFNNQQPIGQQLANIYIRSPQQPPQLQQQQLQQQLQVATLQNPIQNQHLSTLRANLLENSYQNYNYSSLQPTLSRQQQNVSTQNSASNIYRSTASQAQQVANMISTIQLQQFTDTQQPQQFCTPHQSNKQSASQFQQVIPTSQFTTIQQPNPTQQMCPTSTAQSNSLLQHTNHGYINTNSQLNSLLNNNSPRPSMSRNAVRYSRSQSCCTNYNPGQTIRDYSRNPRTNQSPRQTSLLRNVEVPTEDPNVSNTNTTNISQPSTILSDSSLCNFSSSPELVSQCAQPSVSVSSTTQPPNVSSMHSIGVQVEPETFNRACQVDPRPKTMVSRALSATVTVEDKVCQTDDDELGFVIVPKRTCVDRACSPIVALSLMPNTSDNKPVSDNSSPSKSTPPKIIFRTKQTAKRRKREPESNNDSDCEINVVE